MHGKGQIIWQDGRKYTGVIKIITCRNMRKTKNMVEEYLNGPMEESILEHGFRVNSI